MNSPCKPSIPSPFWMANVEKPPLGGFFFSGYRSRHAAGNAAAQSAAITQNPCAPTRA